MDEQLFLFRENWQDIVTQQGYKLHTCTIVHCRHTSVLIVVSYNLFVFSAPNYLANSLINFGHSTSDHLCMSLVFMVSGISYDNLHMGKPDGMYFIYCQEFFF